eukprot:TRINITY_DN62137_c0_g1_i1.p2 TRINITY_DN62137_c0_g1~~TRINITY_DN62137_c0_g1_i1.p2  ORF type:complete len:231 (+),score=90.94 TRINITY_DN62137_c0_g1_i1:86-778(+)
MSGADTIRAIHGLPFDGAAEKADVLAAAITTDFGPIVQALGEVDKGLLVATLKAHARGAAPAEAGVPSAGDCAAFAAMARDCAEREQALAEFRAQRERARLAEAEAELAPCELSPPERQELLSRLRPSAARALKEAQQEFGALAQQRDAVAEGSAEDQRLAREMNRLLQVIEESRRLETMWDPPEGQIHTEGFWAALAATSGYDVTKNRHLIGLRDVWTNEGEEAAAASG